MDQHPADPTVVADTASRLSAAAGHTIHDVVASTSASAQQPYNLSSAAAAQFDVLVSQAGQPLAGVQQLISRCAIQYAVMVCNMTWPRVALQFAATDGLVLQFAWAGFVAE